MTVKQTQAKQTANKAEAKPAAKPVKQVKPKAKFGFNEMSMAQLLAAEVELKNELNLRKREAKRGLMKEMQVKAKAAGLSMSDLLGTGKNKPELQPKYRNPGNPAQTWAGLGKRPDWLKAALAEGKTLQDLSVRS